MVILFEYLYETEENGGPLKETYLDDVTRITQPNCQREHT